jgi:hypothetical protein
MIATTAMLRDEALRTRPLLATTGLSPRTWWSARVAAALVVMAAVYAAIPLGLAAGRAMPWVRADALGPVTPWAFARAFAVLTIPTVTLVTVALATTASLGRRVLYVLATALALVACWQLALALATDPATRLPGALLDPFANAPVLAVTADWSPAERAVRDVPFAGLVAANRLLWLGVAAVVAAIGWGRASWAEAGARVRAFAGAPTPSNAADAGPVQAGLVPAAPAPARAAPAGPPPATVAAGAVARFTAAWILRDGGWRIVMGLAVLNALANALTRPLPTEPGVAGGPGVLGLVAAHSRLFAILLATVYAGELVWRERDLRADAVTDTLPVPTAVMVGGRLAGVFAALGALTGVLAATAGVAGAVRGAWPGVGALAAWGLFVVFTPFAQLTVLSVAVHALLDHKVGAHLLLITGWVVAVGADRAADAPWWLRFGEAAPFATPDGGPAWAALATRAAWWWCACLPLAWLAVRRWPRGQHRTAANATSRR